MESHPVPKNVLTVEFKLFGPLTVNQFLKILAGSVVALVIFAVTPEALRLFALPFIAAFIGLGVMAALIEGFEAKLMGVIRAIFTTTQYVWTKQAKVPDVLNIEEKKDIKSGKVKELKSANENFDDIAIDSLLAARRAVVNQAKQAQSAPAPASAETTGAVDQPNSGNYFEQLYKQAFSGSQPPQQPALAREQQVGVVEQSGGLAAAKGKDSVKMGENLQVGTQSVNNTNLRPLAQAAVANPADAVASATHSVVVDQERIHDLTDQINQLKEQLRSTDPEMRRDATNKIKVLFEELQTLAHPDHVEQRSAEVESHNIFGVVVDHGGTPIAGAEAVLVKEPGSPELLSKAFTKTDGTFNLLIAQEWLGEYIIEVRHPNYRFPEFKIDTNKKNMGYKFRAV